MMNWERRIKHIDRRVKPTAAARLGLRGQLLKAKVKERRGLPSRGLPGELVFERVLLKLHNVTTSSDLDRISRLRRAEMHDRLTERKRHRRDAAGRRARPSVKETCIYLWRRRQDWLRSTEPAARGVGDNTP